MTKIAYTAPTLTEVGSFEAITQGQSFGSLYDHSIPAGVIPQQGTPNFS